MKSPHYTVSSTNPAAHIFEVVLRIPSPAAQEELWLPTWIPGSYLIREFSRNIIDLSAQDEDGALPVHKTSKNIWRIQSREKDISVHYRVYAWDLSVRMAHLDQTHGYFNGTSMFLAVKGREELPQSVTLLAPEGTENWRVATALPHK